jgi:hypothetical protein
MKIKRKCPIEKTGDDWEINIYLQKLETGI